MQATPTVSVVLTTDPGAAPVEACLEALAAAAGPVPYEVILVDSGDLADVPVDALAERYGITVACSTDPGSLLAANVGAELVTGRVVVFLSPHARVRPGWLEPLVAALDDHPTIGIVGPKLLGADGRIEAAGWTVADDGTVMPFGHGWAGDDERAGAACPVDVLSRACLAVRTATWRGLGGFDAVYAPRGFEDADLCFAARAVGWEVRYEPASEAVVTGDADLFGSWSAASHRRFVAKWGAALAHQEPSPAITGHPPRTADRSRRAVDLVRRSDPAPSGAVTVVVPARVGGTDRSSLVIAGFARGGRAVVTLAEDHPRWTGAATRRPAPPVDVVWLDGLALVDRLAVAARHLLPHALVVADVGGLGSTVVRQRAAAGERGASQRVAGAEALERWLLRIPDLVVTTSEAAAFEVRLLVPEADTLVVPLVAEPGGPVRRGGRNTVALAVDVGSAADLDAAQWLCGEVMPRVRMGNRELRATIVGDPSAPALRTLAGTGVAVVPADQAPGVLEQAAVAAAPWRFGSGMHQWAVDALAAGVPLVATGPGGEGLDVRTGRDAMRADTADEMARAIVAVAGDPLLWGALSGAGQDHLHDARLTPAGLTERLAGVAAGHPVGTG